MCTSIVRGSRKAESPQTRSSSIVRLKTRPGCAGEARQDLELHVGEPDGFAAHRRPCACSKSIRRSPASIGSSNSLGLVAQQVGAPEHRLHAAAELAHGERLGDVVVRAELEAEHLVDLLGLGGEHDDRHRCCGRGSDGRRRSRLASGSITSSTTRSKLWPRAALKRLLPVHGGNNFVALLAQRVREQLLDRLLVVDQEDPGGLWRHGWRRGESVPLRDCRFKLLGSSCGMPEP